MRNNNIKIVIILILNSVFIPLLAQNCSIKGVVTDVQNHESLPFANIRVVNTEIRTTTDENGNFKIKNLKAGYVGLEVSYMGYKTKQTEEILITNTNPAYIEIELESADNMIEDINVRPSSFTKREEAPISMQSISTKEIESNPGSNRDISRVIQSFPGVGSTPAFRNDIIIRGGGPAENRFFLDGVEIPILNHFSTQGASGGPVGIINADFIRNVDFYASSFPAARYNALSGVFDFRQKNGSKDKMNVQLAVGASETSATLDGPIGKKTNYIFSVRRSYLQFLFDAIGLPFLPTFNDYQVRLRTNLDKKNQLTIISIGSLDKFKLNTNIDNPEPEQEYIINSVPVNNQWSYTIGAVYKHFFDKGFHTLVLSRNLLNNALYKYPENDETQDKSFDYSSQETENKLRYEYHIKQASLKYVFSGNLEYAKYKNNTKQKINFLWQTFDLKYNTAFNLIKYGLSGQATKSFFNSKLMTSFGFRLDGNNYNKNSANLLNQFSPRISASYRINANNTINASAGRYFQQAAYTSMGYKDNSGYFVNKNSVKYIGMNQYNIGYEHIAKSKILLSIEGFYKQYFNYPIDLGTGSSIANQGADYGVYGATQLAFIGKGKAYGVEVLNRWNYKSFSILASYTFFRSLFTNINDKYIPSSWDSKHLLSITGTKSLNNNWRVGAKWRFVGGLPYTPYDLQSSSNKARWFANRGPSLDYFQLNAERFKPFHQLDIRIDKSFFLKKWSLMLYLDVQNVYNYKSELRDIILRKKDNNGDYITVNDGNNFVLESYNNTIGTIVPTIGIMVKF